jgi:hypothetical protein
MSLFGIFQEKHKSFSNKDVFLVIVLCWIAASFFGSIPFLFFWIVLMDIQMRFLKLFQV